MYISNETEQLHYGDTVDASTILPEDGASGSTVKFYIAGVLNPAKYHLEFTASGGISFNHLIPTYDSEFENGKPFFIMSRRDMAAFSAERLIRQPNLMVIFEDGITPQEYNANLELLSKDCMTISLEQLYEEGVKETQEGLRSMLPMTLCAFLISVIGIVSFNVLHTLTQMKNFSIYYICGCRWRNVLAICCGFLFWVFLPTALLLGLCYLPASSGVAMQDYDPLFRLNNLWLTLGAFLLCFACAILPPWTILKRTRPVALFHKET